MWILKGIILIGLLIINIKKGIKTKTKTDMIVTAVLTSILGLVVVII